MATAISIKRKQSKKNMNQFPSSERTSRFRQLAYVPTHIMTILQTNTNVCYGGKVPNDLMKSKSKGLEARAGGEPQTAIHKCELMSGS